MIRKEKGVISEQKLDCLTQIALYHASSSRAAADARQYIEIEM